MVATVAAVKVFADAGDGGRAHAGLLFDLGVGDAFLEHLGDLPAVGELDDFGFGEQVTEEIPGFV